VNGARDERLKPMTFSWLLLQLFIDIAIAIVRSPIYFMVLAKKDIVKNLLQEVVLGDETLFYAYWRTSANHLCQNERSQ